MFDKIQGYLEKKIEETKRELEDEIQPGIKVIGAGESIADVIKKMWSYKWRHVSVEWVSEAEECFTADSDKVVIIVTRDCPGLANTIARTYHDAGVVTLGILHDADPDCFDSVIVGTDYTEAPIVIRDLLNPVVKESHIFYGVNDLRALLSNSGYFSVKTTYGRSVADVSAEMWHVLKSETEITKIEDISIHLSSSRNRNFSLKMSEMPPLLDLFSRFNRLSNIDWTVYSDDTMSGKELRLTCIITGKELQNTV